VEDLVQVLTKFHREIVVPDIERIVGNAIEGSERRLRDEMHAGFDALAQRLDRLELKARVDGLQEQIHVLETRIAE
jgi:hypothetical protein